MKWLYCVAGLIALMAGSPALMGADAAGREVVVGTVDGRKVTAGELDDYLAGAPPAMAPANRREALQQYALQSTLARMAEQMHLDEQSPYDQTLAVNRSSVLAQALLTRKTSELGEEAAEKWLVEISAESRPTDLNEEFFGLSFLAMGNAPPDTVIATLNGKPMAAGRLREMLRGMGPEAQENFRTQPKEFLAQYARLEHLGQLAEQEKLDQQSPLREQIAWVRLQVMSQARMNAYQDSINIGPKLQQEYYDTHRERYTEARVKAIYVSFAGTAGQKMPDGTPVLTEPEATAKIEEIYKQATGGADFVELVHKHSQEKMSREKDGEFGTMSKGDPNVPAEVRAAVFAAREAGQITRPVKLPNGFYIFRVEEIGTKSLEQVLQTLMVEAKTAKFQEWIDSLRNALDITYEKPEYFDNN